MQDTVDIGIIGLGSRGLLWKRIVENNPALNLVAVSDVHRPNITRHETYRYYEDYLRLLDSGVDAVFVAPQNKYRPKVVTDALARGIHVFCEIPPGRSVHDMEDIIACEKKAGGAVLGFGFTHRFHSAVSKAKEITDSGKYGKILWMNGVHGKSGGDDFESIWRSNREWAGGGILLDQGIRLIDLFLFFAGDFSEVKSIVSTSLWNIPVDDNAFALLRNSQNQIAMLHASSVHWKNTFTLEICLEKGFITIRGNLTPTGDYGPRETLIVSPRPDRHENHLDGLFEESITCFDTAAATDREVDTFVDCIRSGTIVQMGSSADALKSMKLVDRIYRSDRGWWRRWNLSGNDAIRAG
ncbi:Gfo/Idh/MocA family oxidoreductase [Methanoregula sp.]|uniref:Gfo/Idh/MocA family protein n=1 Tax=Methanoregula sp. TaxID=2052170 RepID=UPI002C13FC88|nr:Gfo/Idh/MocA family oxidoreductase [Methanoregula sp.]HVP96071.1 Gfo/Idh/MocA family oxidoreductase [Methanoregula sp.]